MALRVSSIADQVAAHLREAIRRRRWVGTMPGRDPLAKELGVSRKTVQRALEKLEGEGLLVPRGAGRRRLIRLKGQPRSPSMRIGILVSEPVDRGLNYMVELRHELEEAGHATFFAPQYLLRLRMDAGRVGRMVARNPADAWLVLAGSGEVLEWFAEQPIPTLAIFGRRRGVAIASVGPDKPPALAEATRELVRLGHRRIVMLVRRMRRHPAPGQTEQAFLNELEARGITPSPYHLPAWEESIDGFHAGLESLFKVTPPTALIVDEVPFFVAVQQFLAGRSIRIPEEVSLVCTDASPDFDWCRPAVAHIRWDSGPLVRRIVRWVDNVSRGRRDLRQTETPATFVPGGTIGPVNRSAGKRR